MPSVFVRVEGRVQGVGFRAHVVDAARRLGLGGWVRNTEDGAVEAEAYGAVEVLAAFVDACRRGPPRSRVDRLTERIGAGDAGVDTGFVVRR